MMYWIVSSRMHDPLRLSRFLSRFDSYPCVEIIECLTSASSSRGLSFQLYIHQVFDQLEAVARQHPLWVHGTHRLPFFSVNVLKTVAHSGARSAMLTCNGTLEDAYTLLDLCQSILVPMPTYIDRRGRRFPKTKWVEPHGREWDFASRPRVTRRL